MTDTPLLDFEPHKHRHNADPHTSVEAAIKAADFAPNHRQKVFEALKWRAMASEEISAFTRLTYMQVQRRVSDLHNDGVIEPSGRVHKNRSGCDAVVWRVVQGPAIKPIKKPSQRDQITKLRHMLGQARKMLAEGPPNPWAVVVICGEIDRLLDETK